MANPNAPHGLNPIGYVNGAPWTGKANIYHIPAADTNAYLIGDIVRTAATGSDANGVPDVTRAANGATGVTNSTTINRGVIVGMQVAPIGTGLAGAAQGNSVNLNIVSIPATKLNDFYVFVADDPNLIFEVQGNNTAAVTLSATVGLNATFIQGTPVAGDVVSRTVVDLVTTVPVTTATFPLKIVSLPYRVNITNSANLPLLVTLNAHELGHGTGTAGV